jgi:predicted alpha-1,2-mannosidase
VTAAQNASDVDPFIGTGQDSNIPGSLGWENIFPGAVTPFGMVQLSPDTEDFGYGYHYFQSSIHGFSMTHMSGTGCANEGDVFFTATTGPVRTQVDEFASPYSHDQESAVPGYYQVVLTGWNINAELTATDRTGLARFAFPAGTPANVLIPISHTLNETVTAQVHVVGDQQIQGYVEDHAFCGSAGTYKVYFAMGFSQPFSSFGTWNGDQAGGDENLSPGSRVTTQTQNGQWVGAYASWPAAPNPQSITVKVGISYVDLAGAENNLEVEAGARDFDQVRSDDSAKWNEALRVIQVTGGSPSNQRVFYTALYHSLLMPSIFSDADGRYLGFDDQIHQAVPGHLVYCNYSGWDIYRSEAPLLALIVPQRMEDMAESAVLMYQYGGWIDRWPHINRYTNVMAGSPLTVILCMAWLQGLHGFDINTAWEGMLRDATEAPPPIQPYTGEDGIDWINTLHFVPNDQVTYGSVSQLQEDCIAYASLYRLAVQLGKTSEAPMLYQRALYYRNLFNPESGFFQPRNSDGSWAPNFDPTNQDETQGFIEGSGWHYLWLAPSDLAWLIGAEGSTQFNARLLGFFADPQPEWKGQYYNPYDEPDLEAPFEFNFSGEPWESQRVVRQSLAENYTTSPDGLPGNDDCGEMSSWAVLSMMGIYTVDPTSLAYELVSPVFSHVILNLQPPYSGQTITIQASPDPATNPYIQAVTLNGVVHAQNWVALRDLTAGANLQFKLGVEANTAWGSAPEDAPPSLSMTQPQ